MANYINRANVQIRWQNLINKTYLFCFVFKYQHFILQFGEEIFHHGNVFLAAWPTLFYVDDDGKASFRMLENLVHMICLL